MLNGKQGQANNIQQEVAGPACFLKHVRYKVSKQAAKNRAGHRSEPACNKISKQEATTRYVSLQAKQIYDNFYLNFKLNCLTTSLLLPCCVRRRVVVDVDWAMVNECMMNAGEVSVAVYVTLCY